MTKKRKYQLLVSILLIIVAIFLTRKEVQNDVFYSISIGRDILKNGIDFKDHYSFIENLSYTYPHWLFDVIIFCCYSMKGFFGIYLFTMGIYMILGVSMFSIYYKRTDNLLLSSMFSLCALFLLQNFITSRAQSLTYLCFLFEIEWIYELLKTNKKRYKIGLFFLAVVIANVHIAMFPIYFVFYLPFFAEALFAKWKKSNAFFDEKILIKKEKYMKSLIQTFFLCLFAGLITPLRFYPYTYFFQTLIGNSVDVIAEHQPINIQSNLGFFILFGLMIFFLIFTKNKVRFSSLCFFFGLSLLTLLSKRSYALFVILGFIPMIQVLSSFLEEKDRNACDQMISIFLRPFLGITIILFIILGSFVRRGYQENYINAKKYPIEAAKYIKSNLDYSSIHLWNGYNYGSYLLYQGIPVLIDSRADLYTKEFNKEDILTDYQNGIIKQEELFQKYQITHVLLDKEEDLYYLLKEKDLKVLYEDSIFILYEYCI